MVDLTDTMRHRSTGNGLVGHGFSTSATEIVGGELVIAGGDCAVLPEPLLTGDRLSQSR